MIHIVIYPLSILCNGETCARTIQSVFFTENVHLVNDIPTDISTHQKVDRFIDSGVSFYR